MKSIDINTFNNDLDNYVLLCIVNNKVLKIQSDKGNFIMLSKQKYDSMIESLHLYSVPGVKEDIAETNKTPTKELDTKEPWK